MQYTRLTLSALLLVMLCTPALAKYIPKVSVEECKDKTAYILVNSHRAIHFKTQNGDLSPADRAGIVATRLAALLTTGFDFNSISFKTSGRNTNILVGELMLMVATTAEAKAHRCSSAKLAQTWIKELRRILSLPLLSISPTSILIPMGENRTAKIESFLEKPIQVEISDPSIATLGTQSKPGSLVIMGISPGDTVITILCEDYKAQLQVSVKKYAACAVPGVTKALVTGWNASASLVLRAASHAGRRAVNIEPGARISSINIQNAGRELAPGKIFQTPVQVEVEGKDYIPAKLTVQVEVENRPLEPVPTTWIMYSNGPERILKYQMLFTGRITPSQEAFRLLYHHQNMMKKRIGFVIDVLNTSTSPASLHVIEGVSEPMVDTVLVGYKAGLGFMENLQSKVGRVIDIPAGTRWILVSQCLDYPQTASGIMELRQLSGDPLFVRVMIKPEDQRSVEDPADMPKPAQSIDASRITLSDHIYPGPIKNLETTFTIGKPWVFLRIGKYALKHATQNKQLFGNYGVTYDIKATLENPTNRQQTVEFSFEATAGPASGLFYIDGNLVRVKSLQPPHEASLGKVTVPAGRSKIVSIRTIPLSGSAYPATLIIRPAGTTGGSMH